MPLDIFIVHRLSLWRYNISFSTVDTITELIATVSIHQQIIAMLLSIDLFVFSDVTWSCGFITKSLEMGFSVTKRNLIQRETNGSCKIEQYLFLSSVKLYETLWLFARYTALELCDFFFVTWMWMFSKNKFYELFKVACFLLLIRHNFLVFISKFRPNI